MRRHLLQLSALALVLACGAAAPSPAPAPPTPDPPAASSAVQPGKAAAPPESPAPVSQSIPLTVRETAGIARSGEVLRSGVPLPRDLGVRDLARLAVLDPAGKAVPAEFEALARWGGGRDDATAPVEWLLVSFPASVGAGRSAVYRLVTGGAAGSNPSPPAPLKLSREGDRFTVDTGAAVFRFGGDKGALFDEVRLSNGPRLAGGGRMTARPAQDGGAPVAHDALRSVRIEHQGPLSAVVIVEGAYAMPPVGGGGLGSLRRYVFTAGSPTAIVRQSIAWEGSLSGGCNGCLVAHGAPNGVLLTGLRDELSLTLGDPADHPAGGDSAAAGAGGLRVQAIGGRKDADLAGAVAAGQEAFVRQLLRPNRGARLACDVQVAGQRAACQRADGGVLAASGRRGTVAIALNRMHRYEPQALRLLPGGSLAVDWADDKVWLANHEGLFATFAVAALPPGDRPAGGSNAGRAELDREVWAPLEQPLHAWPEASWFAASQAVPDLPVGPLPRGLRDYDRLVGGMLKATIEHVDSEGLSGLMTYGLFPRYWGQWGSPEIDCGGHDPTPGESWDDLFWCGTWTDYHNTLATAPLWAMRTGEVEWLDDLGFPGQLSACCTPRSCSAPRATAGSTAARRRPATAATVPTSTAPTPISRTSSSTTG